MRRTTRRLRPLFILFIFTTFTTFPEPIDMDRVNAREDFHWGVNAFHLGYFGKAVQSFEDALRLAPDDQQVRTWLARTYFRLGFEDTALAMWKDIVKAGRGTPMLEYVIHVVAMRKGLGRELASPGMFVVNHVLDASRPDARYFKRPSAVYTLPDGTFYVVGYGSNEVLSLNANSVIVGTFRGGVETLDHPFDLLVASDHYFISEFEGNVVSRFDKNFVKINSFGGTGIGDGKLLGPQYMAVDQDGYLYVTDWGNRRVSKYDLNGNFILSFGKQTAFYPHQKLEPTGIAIAGGRVYVSDQYKKQIVVFDTSGNYLDCFGEGVLKSPEGLEFYNDDILLVADGDRIMSISLGMGVWKMWSDVSAQAKRIVDLALTPNGDILAADFDANKVFVISEVSTLYSGFFVQVERVDSTKFPEVMIDLSVEDIHGNPVVGLTPQNLFVTEANVPVTKPAVVLANTQARPLSVVILVEDSLDLDKYDKEIRLCIENVRGVLGKDARIKIVFAREDGVLEADFASYDERKINEVISRRGIKNWKLDLGVKTAVAELLPERGRHAVICLTSGVLKDSAFGIYNLQEVARMMRNNGVCFYPVYIGASAKNRELEYIMNETSGKSYIYFDPQGLTQLVNDVTTAPSSTYVIRYTSTSDSEFGRKYIPLEVQVLVYKKSGRDESGYFAPLIYK